MSEVLLIMQETFADAVKALLAKDDALMPPPPPPLLPATTLADAGAA